MRVDQLPVEREILLQRRNKNKPEKLKTKAKISTGNIVNKNKNETQRKCSVGIGGLTPFSTPYKTADNFYSQRT